MTMLTKDDLQAIRKIVNDEVQVNLQQELQPIKVDIEILKKEVKPLKSIRRDIRRIKKDIEYMSGKFDENDVFLQRRVARVDERVGIS